MTELDIKLYVEVAETNLTNIYSTICFLIIPFFFMGYRICYLCVFNLLVAEIIYTIASINVRPFNSIGGSKPDFFVLLKQKLTM